MDYDETLGLDSYGDAYLKAKLNAFSVKRFEEAVANNPCSPEYKQKMLGGARFQYLAIIKRQTFN